ncbi:LOW QUALITY PROTEIN: RNA binding methyltransferase FtsJ like [Geomicrobium sp. JCM 19039]|nr:LOW QUALITY PROTEIN: RNA binding methyltransferase FtsJ like [Geomicrobium sp. JCM 19039]
MNGKKERVDILLVEQGLSETREKARRAIMAGLVHTERERIDKPGTKIDRDTPLFVKGQECPVSRGGMKLHKALDVFNVSIEGKVVLDVGASTGGFTDCALQHLADQVYAVDVGYNQLHWKLRSDDRVVVMERMNFRYADQEDFTHGLPQFAVCDVSFISLKHIFPPMQRIIEDESDAIVLVKPQFEAGREEVGKRGIVRDKNVHRRVIEDVLNFADESGLQPIGLDVSPITGTGGNIEFLLHLRKNANPSRQIDASRIALVIKNAHSA